MTMAEILTGGTARLWTEIAAGFAELGRQMRALERAERERAERRIARRRESWRRSSAKYRAKKREAKLAAERAAKIDAARLDLGRRSFDGHWIRPVRWPVAVVA